MHYLRKVVANPGYYFRLAISLLRGAFYIIYYWIFNRNVKINMPFLVFGKLTISGPGRVEIGSRCLVMENVFKGLTIITLSKESHVKIGNNCMLAGLTIHCRSSVDIGNKVMTARSLVQDNYFVNIEEAIKNQSLDVIKSMPVIIGDNVWVGGHCIILGGTTIGCDSVLSAFSVCSNDVVKEFSLVSGNPVRKALPIEQLLKLRNAT